MSRLLDVGEPHGAWAHVGPQHGANLARFDLDIGQLLGKPGTEALRVLRRLRVHDRQPLDMQVAAQHLRQSWNRLVAGADAIEGLDPAVMYSQDRLDVEHTSEHRLSAADSAPHLEVR